MDLWQRHRVELLIRGEYNLIWADANESYLPKTNDALVSWILDKIKEARGDHYKLECLAKDVLLFRVGVRHSGNSLRAFPISWAQFLLMTDDSARETLKPENFYVFAVSCLIETADNKFLLSFRSKNVSRYGQCYHISAAGYIDCSTEKKYNPATQVIKEIEEEIGLRIGEYDEPVILGVCRHLVPNSAIIEACYYAKTHLSSKKVLKRSISAKDSWEGRLSAYNAAEVIKLLESKKFNPGGAATILLTLNRR